MPTDPQKALDDAIEMASAVGKTAAKKQKVDQAAADIRAAALTTEAHQHKKGTIKKMFCANILANFKKKRKRVGGLVNLPTHQMF